MRSAGSSRVPRVLRVATVLAQQVECSLPYLLLVRDNRVWGRNGPESGAQRGPDCRLSSDTARLRPCLRVWPRLSSFLLCSIPGKKKTEKWQPPSGPLWLHNSKRRHRGWRTERRAAGPRKRKQQPGRLRSPVATGVCPGLRAKARVTSPT